MTPRDQTPARERPVRVVVVDDSPDVVATLSSVLDADGRFSVVGSALSPVDVDALAALVPDLAIVDVKMPDGGGFAATRRILELSPTTLVVALSAFSTPSLRRRMQEAGAVAYLTKGMLGDDLLDQLADICSAGSDGPGSGSTR